MTTYLVTWEIEIDADSEREAAGLARDIQLDPNNTATCFKVCEVPIDIDLETL